MFMRKSIIWQIFPQNLLLLIVSLVIVTIFASDALKHLYFQRIRTDLGARGQLISQILSQKLKKPDIPVINEKIHKMAVDLDMRITIILPDGLVIADSEHDYRTMENHADRPEIREAYAGRTGSSIRFGYTLSQNMFYVAVPVTDQGKTIAVVRTSMPLSDLNHTLDKIYQKIILTGLIIILCMGIIGFIYAYSFNKPIHAIRTGAQKIGNGELDHQLYITKPKELQNLADSINTMANQLKERIKIITEQRNELEAILSNMIEAVLVVDTEEHVIRINHAMATIFDLDPAEAVGKELQTVIRNIGIQRFVRKTLNSQIPQEDEFSILDKSERIIQAHGTLLTDINQQTIGCLIVMNDMTRQKSLENIRREFVANVSHELKTPITAIHGFVETLREGAINDKQKAPEFLDIILKHTDRLNAIIEDLLNLSRIERDMEKGEIHLESLALYPVLQETITLCENKASEKGIHLNLEADSTLQANINAPLLTQAFVNLTDNAIKYSPDNSTVLIRAFQEGDHITIRVKDNGIGIPQEDIPRIFERFYRVDQTRSRKLGGTGLGLAIVKHIVQIHRGTLSVESRLKQGSTFTIQLNV